ncbi:50S ribosomal protein L6 [Candidatus Woesearchaeota archaeon]|nr:50S ribosomal protein L6 [Candidatus Woesearchaeota archaeon]
MSEKRVQKTKGKKDAARELAVPEGVSVAYAGGIFKAKGKSGECSKALVAKNVSIKIEGEKILLSAKKATKREKRMIATFISHMKNMLRGSNDGHTYVLKICSGHFPMTVSSTKDEFVVKNFIGEKIPRKLKIKAGAAVKVDGDKVVVQSASKEIAGQVSADIENLTKRANYDTRIFQDGIYIVNKDGKELK